MTSRHTALTLTAIIALALIVFSPCLGNGFTNWDDPDYVLNNPLIRTLDAGHVRALFTTDLYGKYHPLTLLSYALDVRLWAFHPLGYHLDNLLLHLLNILLVFGFIRRLSGHTGYALGTALIFAVHPLNAEPVAWVSGRKDVLFTLFYLSALLFYLRGLRSARPLGWMLAVFTAFLCALLSKLMAFSLPLILLLIDRHVRGKITWKDAVAKIPFLGLSAAFALFARQAAQTAQAFPGSALFSPWERIELSLAGLWGYLIRFVVPHRLSALHPVSAFEPLTAWLGAALLAGGLFLLWKVRKTEPLIVFGGLFFLLTIAPVLHLLEVNDSLIYERFFYVPGIGLGLILTRVFARYRKHVQSVTETGPVLMLAAAGIYILSLSAISFQRSLVWKDSASLWQNVLASYPHAATAYANLAAETAEQGQTDEALALYQHAIESEPLYTEAYFQIGNLLAQKGRYLEAAQRYGEAIALNPEFTNAWINRANMSLLLKKDTAALADYTEAARLDPENPVIYLNRGMLFFAQGDDLRAQEDFRRALGLDPGNALALEKLRELRRGAVPTARKTP